MNKNEVTILDAGMGRNLRTRGVEIPATIWSANALIVAPEIVVDIHKENIKAGASLITTNSYGVIKADLAKENIADQFESLNQSAGQLARRAVEESDAKVEIAGSLPPLNGSYRPDRVMKREVIEPLYLEQASILAPFVDFFICETMSSVGEALAAASAALKTGKPVLVALTLDDEKFCCLRSGESLAEALDKLSSLNLLGVLANCCLPERISEAIPILSAFGSAYCGGYANAFTHVPKDWMLDGTQEEDGLLELRRDLEPDQYSSFVQDWINQGANIVGGCCGTTAEHTAANSALVSSLQEARISP